MQFDMVHCDGPAVLWDPPFVLASVVWAAILALVWLHRRRVKSPRGFVLACVALTPIAINEFVRGVESGSSCGIFGRGLWMAVPLAAALVALWRLAPAADPIALTARAVALLTCLHAWWTVTLFRQDIGAWGLRGLDDLEAKVAPAPWVALLVVTVMSLVYVLVERRAEPQGWRAWIVVRVQLLLAFAGLTAEARFASARTVYEGVPPDPLLRPIVALALGVAVQAWLKAKAGRTSATQQSPPVA